MFFLGVVEIIRPNKDDGSKSPKSGKTDRHGFIYVVLRSEEHVRSLLCDARKSKNKNGAQKFSINLTSRRLRSKDVEVKAWALSNSAWQQHGAAWEVNSLNPKKTIFVGALHGEINAEMLQRIMAVRTRDGNWKIFSGIYSNRKEEKKVKIDAGIQFRSDQRMRFLNRALEHF